MTPTDFARDPIQSTFVRLGGIECRLLDANNHARHDSLDPTSLRMDLAVILFQVHALMDQLRPLLDGVPE